MTPKKRQTALLGRFAFYPADFLPGKYRHNDANSRGESFVILFYHKNSKEAIALNLLSVPLWKLIRVENQKI